MGSPCRPQTLFVALVVLGSSIVVLVQQIMFADGVWNGGASLDIWRGGRSPTLSQLKTQQTSKPWFQSQQPLFGNGHKHGAILHPAEATARRAQQHGRNLAIVVPCNAENVLKASASLAKWPSICHSSTRTNTDLIMYYAGGEGDDVAQLLPALAKSGGRCFANTRLVNAYLRDEESHSPEAESIQFFKIFLDTDVRKHFSEYDALAIIEWNMIVAHDTSFERLYSAAFGGVEPFWIKGSNLGGMDFQETVLLPENQRTLGHINGNALYNNSDQAFVEFVNYTAARWDHTERYDVALWATIADFPYSWPLWQRFSRKFVVTGLIADVDSKYVDYDEVQKAVAHETLFIHTRFKNQRGGDVHARGAALASSPALLLGERSSPTDGCKAECGAPGALNVCDLSCSADEEHGARFGGYLCGAGASYKYGANCRKCFESMQEAQDAEEILAVEEKLAVDHNKSRQEVDAMQQRHVIACDTLMPPPPPPPATSCSSKCQMKSDTVCDRSCETGRYGGYNCNWRGYGVNCRFCFNDRQAALVANEAAKLRGGVVIMCDTFEPPTEIKGWEPPIIPPNKGASPFSNEESDYFAGGIAYGTELTPPADAKHLEDRRKEVYVKDITRGQICAFMIGYSTYLKETEIAARSVLHLMPGLRIAIATHPDELSDFRRTLGDVPSVKLSKAIGPVHLAALFADRHCGKDTKLIWYMTMGELLSREFTAKDTHSVAGDLLVSYTEVSRVGQAHVKRAMATMALLGFSSPSFSFGTDLILPVDVNQKLRDLLISEREGTKRGRTTPSLDADTRAIRALETVAGAHVPEVLAALAYSQNEVGLWFINPQQWVTRHMFQHASVWEIPLIKPRFGCAFDLSMATRGVDVAIALGVQLEHFVSGASCRRGFLSFDPVSSR